MNDRLKLSQLYDQRLCTYLTCIAVSVSPSRAEGDTNKRIITLSRRSHRKLFMQAKPKNLTQTPSGSDKENPFSSP